MSRKPHLSFVVAMDSNRLIGAHDGLPWRLPDDMKFFKAITMGKPVIMGRKTYESIPAAFRPLTGRKNIIVTGDKTYQAEGCIVAHSIEEALAAAGEVAEIIVGGGAEVYRQLLPQADRIYLTLVEGQFKGDVYFPQFDMREWREVAREIHEPDERHPYRFNWIILERC
jgi:dihydrofolate reductase